MRFYQIVVTNKDGSLYRQWTSQLNGYADPGAHQVEFDVFATAYATPVGDSTIRIWGVQLADIAQASDFNGKTVSLIGGMQKGLPLANPSQQGELVSGEIWQAFGNWQGTDMTLDFIVKPSAVSLTTPGNIIVNWKAGTPLADALAATLTTAFPKYKQQISISPNLVLSHDEVHFCATVEQLAGFLESVTLTMLGSTYQGVQVTLRNNTFIVYDGSTPTTPIPLLFTDLVGQPTWYDAYQAQITTVMRGDIQVGNYLKMPTGFQQGAGSIVTQPQSMSQYSDHSVFQGTMQVNQVRHVGSFRDPDGRSWVSIFNCSFVA